jgi:HSP90 family molecular chaperone
LVRSRSILRVSRRCRKKRRSEAKKYGEFLEKYSKFLEKYGEFLEKYGEFFRFVLMQDSNRGANMFSNRFATPYFASSFGYRGGVGKIICTERKKHSEFLVKTQ